MGDQTLRRVAPPPQKKNSLVMNSTHFSTLCACSQAPAWVYMSMASFVRSPLM